MKCALPIATALLCVAMSVSCRQKPPAGKPALEMIWRPVGNWTGHGNRQTESFTSDTGALRVRWETRPSPGARGEGRFLLLAHSAVSGRILQQVVEERGAASGVDYVTQDPHVFYLSVESTGLEWSFSVDEGIAGEKVGHRGG